VSKKFWEIKNSAGNTGEVFIYGDIVSWKWDDTDVTAADFKKDLDALGDINTLNVYINSYGGSVFQGQAIYSILKRHDAFKNVFVDGIAASIASLIAMAGDKIHMPANAMMMIHNPISLVIGNAEAMRKEADALDKIREAMIPAYLNKSGDKLTEDKLVELLGAETWLTAQDCFDYGFCDELLEEKQVAASISTDLLAGFKNVPAALKNAQKGDKEAEVRRAIAEKSRESLAQINKILGGM
jgi:ATP-dependent Clp protease protease subunit